VAIGDPGDDGTFFTTTVMPDNTIIVKKLNKDNKLISTETTNPDGSGHKEENLPNGLKENTNWDPPADDEDHEDHGAPMKAAPVDHGAPMVLAEPGAQADRVLDEDIADLSPQEKSEALDAAISDHAADHQDHLDYIAKLKGAAGQPVHSVMRMAAAQVPHVSQRTTWL
jgi:hypothetical protein